MIAVDAQNDAAKQTNDVEDLIQKGVDVVVINPTDSDAVASAVSAANAANVPVITVDALRIQVRLFLTLHLIISKVVKWLVITFVN